LLDGPHSDVQTAAGSHALASTSRTTGPIVVLSGGGPLPWIIINAVVDRLGPVTVLEETPEPTTSMFRRRLRKLGAIEVAGQLAFGVLQRALRLASRRRLDEIIATHRLKPVPSSDCTVIQVGSVNADACRRELARLKPAVVLVIGTRIIRRETLSSVQAPFINYHAGINPKYRGMCGGYWALANGDAEHFGATVHLVDEGVDTGDVLYCESVARAAGDNFVTYPFRLAVAGRGLVLQALDDALRGRLRAVRTTLPSHQWYHPTLWGYLWTGITRRVW
jgi:hypothetical protein